MRLATTSLVLAIAGAVAAAACGDDEPSSNGADGGAGGSADASAGAAGEGGSSQGGGSGGTAGSTAGGGAGGEAGGSAGVGGAAGGEAGAGGAGGGGAGSDAGAAPSDAGPEAAPLQGSSPPYPPVPYPPQNLHGDAKAMLGKILFWDEQIGEDGTMACGTCHRAAAGGSDPRAALEAARVPGPDGVLVSPATATTTTSDDIRGAQGVVRCEETDGGIAVVPEAGTTVQVTGRKPPTYLDAMFAPDIFWDGRATRDFTDPDTGTVYLAGADAITGQILGYGLESQSVGPPLSDVEMACIGQTWADIHDTLRTAVPLAKTQNSPLDMRNFIALYNNSYPEMFAAAYGSALKSLAGGDDEINTVRIAFAIATHERRLKSDQTPWDRWNAGDDTAMTANQIRGFELFMTKAQCSACHTPPLFTDLKFHFIGFHKPAWDLGRFNETSTAAERGAMKTPTLRNVGLREPGGLLHRGDGPGKNLDTVMELYNLGGLREDTDIAPSIDALVLPLNLTQQEIDLIIDFMRNGLTDPRVRNETSPFDRPRLGSEP